LCGLCAVSIVSAFGSVSIQTFVQAVQRVSSCVNVQHLVFMQSGVDLLANAFNRE
jgi:hypothetical protein